MTSYTNTRYRYIGTRIGVHRPMPLTAAHAPAIPQREIDRGFVNMVVIGGTRVILEDQLEEELKERKT